jgi:hypothetical protein
MKRKRNIFFNILFWAGWVATFAQGEILLRIEPDTSMFLIGEQIGITMTVQHPDNFKINIPLLQEFIDPGIEIMESSKLDTLSKQDRIVRLQQRHTITSFDSGYYEIPPMPFVVHFGNRVDTIMNNPIPLGVLTLQLDTANRVFDIKPQLDMKYTLAELVNAPVFWISLGTLLAALLIVLLIKYRKKPEALSFRPKPEIPAHVIALRELDELKAEKLWQQNQLKEYYSRLTNIIRHYIELRFQINALEQTSSEILMEFRRIKLVDEKLVEHLHELLSLADLVKFAKGTALPDENEKNMESAYDFVRKTKAVSNLQANENQTEMEEVVEPFKALDKNA